MGTLVQHFFVLIARVLLSLLFIFTGVMHILNWDFTRKLLIEEIQPSFQVEISGASNVLLALAVGCLLLGGFSILVGVKARFGALLLIVFLIPTTFFFHDFWLIDPTDVANKTNQMLHFLKNLGLLGGMLMVLGFGSGGFSIDTIFRTKAPK